MSVQTSGAVRLRYQLSQTALSSVVVSGLRQAGRVAVKVVHWRHPIGAQ